MAVLKFVGNITRVRRFNAYPFDEVLQEIALQTIVGLDTETNVVSSILNRILRVVSVAWDKGENVAVFEWDFLNENQQRRLLDTLKTKKCIIQNISFDYSILKKYGVVLENVVDTYLNEQVLTTGLASEAGYHGLQSIYKRRLDLDISKADQLTFGDGGPYSDDQVQYAAVDVIGLEKVLDQQYAEMKADDLYTGHTGRKGLKKTAWWESEFAKVVADMETTGIRLDKEKWYAISDEIQPIYDEELANLNRMVLENHKQLLIDNEWYFEKDTFTQSLWTSTTKKLEFLLLYFPGLEKTAKTELKKYLAEHDPMFPEELQKALNGKAWANHSYPITLKDKYAVLKLLILNSKEEEWVENALNEMALTNNREWLIEKEVLAPAFTVSINWASPTQRLKVFQEINPEIESTGKDIIEEYEHLSPIISHYMAWGEVEYQLKNFGKAFYDAHVQIDGKHRTRYNQILSTGRLSSVKPNILNIPRKISAYRKAIIPDEGFKFINADFSSQELFITATLSQEPEWLKALALGWDLHSRNADMVYGERWRVTAEPTCEYFAIVDGKPSYQKCSCPKHKDLRDNVKTVGFGIIYGISKFSLAFQLKITLDEAEFLITTFFEKAPNIKRMMDRFGSYALEKGRIIEPVFGRARFFEKWKLMNPEEHGAITRASYNFPIQASGSALLKISLVLLRRHIIHNNLQPFIQILMPYHDEISIQAKPEYVEIAKKLLSDKMMLAASLAGFKGLQAEAHSGDSWYDSH